MRWELLALLEVISLALQGYLAQKNYKLVLESQLGFRKSTKLVLSLQDHHKVQVDKITRGCQGCQSSVQRGTYCPARPGSPPPPVMNDSIIVKYSAI